MFLYECYYDNKRYEFKSSGDGLEHIVNSFFINSDGSIHITDALCVDLNIDYNQDCLFYNTNHPDCWVDITVGYIDIRSLDDCICDNITKMNLKLLGGCGAIL